mgnify:CR=1 FL=1
MSITASVFIATSVDGYIARPDGSLDWLAGGVTIHVFLRESAIDTMTITWIPVLLGRGMLLLGELGRDVHLDHEQTKSYRSGCVQTTYRIRHSETSGAA